MLFFHEIITSLLHWYYFIGICMRYNCEKKFRMVFLYFFSSSSIIVCVNIFSIPVHMCWHVKTTLKLLDEKINIKISLSRICARGRDLTWTEYCFCTWNKYTEDSIQLVWYSTYTLYSSVYYFSISFWPVVQKSPPPLSLSHFNDLILFVLNTRNIEV